MAGRVGAAEGDPLTSDLESAGRILMESDEPLSPEAIAAGVLGGDGRPILPYSMTATFAVGDRISFDMSYGRLVGVVETCEFAAGRWRMSVSWDPALSPGLRQYLARRQRKDSRVFYVFDPTGAPSSPIDVSVARSDTPSLVELLSRELEEELRKDGRFVATAGVWAPRIRLPMIDRAELERALLRATMDDGVAQTDQVLGLMSLPGPAETGHGFAAMAVNRIVTERGGWIWGGPRDGGEWLPDNAIAKVFAVIGLPPLVEDVLAKSTVPVLSDEDLPRELEDFLIDETMRELSLATSRGRLVHIVSHWERVNRILRFDGGERRFLPEQARIFVTSGSVTSAALVDLQAGMLRIESPEIRDRLGLATEVVLERLGDTDTFRLEITEGGGDETAVEPQSVLAMIIAAFPDDRSVTAREVLDAVLRAHAGDRAVVARIVAMCLATYACFESADDITYTYRAERGHAIIDGATRSLSVASITRHSQAQRRRAEDADRDAGRFRLAERGPSWVRGHRRTLQEGQRASVLQMAVARRHGIRLAEDQTFVRPHRRHAHDTPAGE